jgi:hypothetical protein
MQDRHLVSRPVDATKPVRVGYPVSNKRDRAPDTACIRYRQRQTLHLCLGHVFRSAAVGRLGLQQIFPVIRIIAPNVVIVGLRLTAHSCWFAGNRLLVACLFIAVEATTSRNNLVAASRVTNRAVVVAVDVDNTSMGCGVVNAGGAAGDGAALKISSR